MSDSLMALVPQYGLWLIGLVTLLSCLAVPVPSSLLMVAGGSFAAAGDMSLFATVAAALTGAIIGDQLGYAIGKRASHLVQKLHDKGGQRKILLTRAQEFSKKWGGIGVFLSRWLLSPLGPYVNFIGGASGINWTLFTTAAIAGEVIWVTLYTGLGFVFADQIEMVADIASNLSGFLAAGTLAFILGRLALRSGNNPAR